MLERGQKYTKGWKAKVKVRRLRARARGHSSGALSTPSKVTCSYLGVFERGPKYQVVKQGPVLAPEGRRAGSAVLAPRSRERATCSGVVRVGTNDKTGHVVHRGAL